MSTLDVRKHELLVVERYGKQPAHLAKGQLVATIGSSIKFKAIFESSRFEGWKDIHYDLLVVSAAIEFADRRWARGAHWGRNFHVTVPVLQVDTWRDCRLALIEAVNHLTGDDWRFTFESAKSHENQEVRQRPLPFEKDQKKFAIAYSEGLDSFCVERLVNSHEEAVCVRVSYQKPRSSRAHRTFDRLRFRVSVRQDEHSGRSRGFKFAAVSAIAADLAGVNSILVPESGQGALGPVLVQAMGLYADYRNYPTFLRRMEHLVCALFKRQIKYKQPRLWHTKGQTIADYLALPGANVTEIQETRSCWQKRRNVCIAGARRQCGICSACLLRRMSMHAADAGEDPNAYAISNLSLARFRNALPSDKAFKATATLSQHGLAAVTGLQSLAEMASWTDARLRHYVLELSDALDTSIEEVQSSLHGLLKQHAIEWNAFRSSLGKSSFINCWTAGELHG